MRINPCSECGNLIDIASDHAPGCSKRSGIAGDPNAELRELSPEEHERLMRLAVDVSITTPYSFTEATHAVFAAAGFGDVAAERADLEVAGNSMVMAWTRVGELQARIDAAPHTDACMVARLMPRPLNEITCTCWKSS